MNHSITNEGIKPLSKLTTLILYRTKKINEKELRLLPNLEVKKSEDGCMPPDVANALHMRNRLLSL